jgi:hypothetical protein
MQFIQMRPAAPTQENSRRFSRMTPMAGAGQEDRRQKGQRNHGSHGRRPLHLIRVIGEIRGGFFFYRELHQAREFRGARPLRRPPDKTDPNFVSTEIQRFLTIYQD